MLITSSQNERIKQVRMLQQQGKARRKQQRLVLEGARLMADALDTGAQPDYALHTEEADSPGTPTNALLVRLRDACPVFAITPELMAALSDTETPQGVLGVFPLPELRVPDEPALIVVADGWRDPGNLGTLIRTCAAAGVDLLLLTKGTVDPTNPKAIRAAMGAHYRVPLRTLDWDAIAQAYPAHRFYLADAAGETLYTDADWRVPSALVIGGEAHGFDAAAERIPHTRVRIPMAPGAESLNAAIAAAVLIYAARAHAFG
ncbi:MAG: RNA methyltransferase [Chloroflexi bacterium]|nr:RNA methyltransferase [Chloroflexota bacterium]